MKIGRNGAALVTAAACAAIVSAAQVAEGPGNVPPADDSGPAAASPATRLAPDEAIPPAELEAFVDGAVRAAMDQNHIVGAAVAVVQDDQIVLQKGYGFASLEPARPVDPGTTLFRIGSITKTFTWIAVMKAVEEGRLDLDAPVNTYLPDDLQIPDEGFTRPIRIRELMTHSPGFEDRALGILFENDPRQIRPLAQYLRESRPSRVREPGELTSYSNYGSALAGAAVGHVRGRPWQEIVEEQILTPLAMTRTTVREPYPPRDDLPAPMAENLARDSATGYRWTGSTHARRSFEFITHTAPAGVMSATAGDMAIYMRMLLNDGTLGATTVFGRRAAEAFRTPMTSLPREVGSLNAGFFQMPLPGGFSGYGHNGGTLTFFTNMTVVPELRLGVFVATNTEGGSLLSDRLPGRVVERFYAPPRAPPAGSLDVADDGRRYAGAYLPMRRAYGGLESFLTRLLTVPVTVTPDGFLAVTFFGETHRLVRAESPETFQGVDSGLGLTFDRDGDRPAHRIRHVSVTLDRVGPLYQPQTLMLFALLAALASAATIAGFCLRIGRRLPATRPQRLTGRATLAASILWLASIACLAVWGTRASDVANVVYEWPAPLVEAASAAALLASIATAAGVVCLVAAWRRDSAGEGWTFWRTLRVSATLLLFAAFAMVLGFWGALQPWAS